MQYAEYQIKPGYKKAEKRVRIHYRVSEFAIIVYFMHLFPDNLQNKQFIMYVSKQGQSCTAGNKKTKLTFARKEHEPKMRILQLREWKHKNQCK